MQWHLDWWVENLEAGVAWAIDCGAVESSVAAQTWANELLGQLRPI